MMMMRMMILMMKSLRMMMRKKMMMKKTTVVHMMPMDKRTRINPKGSVSLQGKTTLNNYYKKDWNSIYYFAHLLYHVLSFSLNSNPNIYFAIPTFNMNQANSVSTGQGMF